MAGRGRILEMIGRRDIHIGERIAVKIVAIEVCPLTGATVDGGWPQGHEPRENLHTLLVVRTDEGLEGFGSCFTSGKLVTGAVELLWPLLRGESAVEPERVSETLRQSSFWQGRGGAVEHAISGIDLALWDLMGKACGQPVSRLLGGTTGRRSSRMARSCSTSRNRSVARWKASWNAGSGRSSWAGGPSGAGTAGSMRCW